MQVGYDLLPLLCQKLICPALLLKPRPSFSGNVLGTTLDITLSKKKGIKPHVKLITRD